MPKRGPQTGYALTKPRREILQVLAAEPGMEISDEDGFATRVLQEKLGLDPDDNLRTLSMKVLDLAKLGLIERDVSAGRKTYRIALKPEAIAPEHWDVLGLREHMQRATKRKGRSNVAALTEGVRDVESGVDTTRNAYLLATIARNEELEATVAGLTEQLQDAQETLKKLVARLEG